LAAAFTSIFTLTLTYFKFKETAPIKTGITGNKAKPASQIESEIGIESDSITKTKTEIEKESDSITKTEIEKESDSITKTKTETETEIEPENLHSMASMKHEKWYKDPSLIRALSILSFSSFGFMTLISNFANFAYAKFSLDATSMGLLLMLTAVVQIISRFTIYMPLLKKWGEYLMALIGFVIYLIVFLAFFILTELYQFIVILVFFSLATSMTRGSVTSFISNLANPWERGKVQGISASLDTFAQIIGPLIGGTLLTYFDLKWFTSVSWVFMLIALILLATATQMRHDLSQKNENFHKVQRNNHKVKSEAQP